MEWIDHICRNIWSCSLCCVLSRVLHKSTITFALLFLLALTASSTKALQHSTSQSASVNQKPVTQDKARQSRPSNKAAGTCDHARARLLIEQQIDLAKTITDSAKRIGAILAAADELWPKFQRDARDAFTIALDQANKNLDDDRLEAKRKNDSYPAIHDYRLEVLMAIAARDPAWARSLVVKMAEDDRTYAENSSSTFGSRFARSSDALVDVASAMLTTSEADAIAIVRDSFKYQLGPMLPQFFYNLAAIDQPGADSLYREALGIYGQTGIPNLFYLSAYPFATEHILLPVYGTRYTLPGGYAPSADLQQMYLGMLMQRAQEALKAANPHPIDGYGLTEIAVFYVAFTQLEPAVASYQPESPGLYAALEQQLQSHMLPGEANKVGVIVLGDYYNNNPSSAFDEMLARIDEVGDSDQRQAFLIPVIVNAPESIALAKMERLIRRIDDSELRATLYDRLYFKYSIGCLKPGRLDLAKSNELAQKISTPGRRAYVQYLIADQIFKTEPRSAVTKQTLENIVATANKAGSEPGEHEGRIRALLGASVLYSKLDAIRSAELLADAVSILNKADNPEIGAVTVRQPLGHTGETLDFGFEAAQLKSAVSMNEGADFDRTLLCCQSISDKYLRSIAIICLAGRCLQNEGVGDRKPSGLTR